MSINEFFLALVGLYLLVAAWRWWRRPRGSIKVMRDSGELLLKARLEEPAWLWILKCLWPYHEDDYHVVRVGGTVREPVNRRLKVGVTWNGRMRFRFMNLTFHFDRHKDRPQRGRVSSYVLIYDALPKASGQATA